MNSFSIPALLPALVLSCAAVVELFLRLPFMAQVEAVNGGAMRALSVVRSPRISDHWKERILPAYAGRILRASLTLAALLVLCAAVFVLVYLPLAWWPAGGWQGAWASLGSGRVQLYLLGIGVVWAMLRLRLGRKAPGSSDYSGSAQMLHRLALGSDGMKSLLDDLDRRLAGERTARGGVEQPVYVTALARAGTTVLLEALYASGQFTAQTYRAMPFVMAPWTWGGLSRSGGGKGSGLKERAHGDRMKISVDSPEAFEEVFWSTYAAREVNDPDGLRPAGAAPDGLLERYRSYVQRILARDAVRRGTTGRYLCKNNNNILRVPWLLEAFPDARIITPFRHPADHVRSLMRQHRRFLERHAHDPFSLEYMDWLGHHEFGAHFRPFKLGEGLVPGDPQDLLTPDYWVRYWTAVYRYLLEHHGDQLLWFDYDHFCEFPRETLGSLAAALALPAESLCGFADRVARSPGEPDENIRAALTPECLALYAQLQASNQFPGHAA